MKKKTAKQKSPKNSKGSSRQILDRAIFDDIKVFRVIVKDIILSAGGFSVVSKKSGLSIAVLKDMIKPDSDPTLGTVRKLAVALELSPVSFFG